MIEEEINSITELLKELSVKNDQQTAEIVSLRQELNEVKTQLAEAISDKKSQEKKKKKGSFPILSALKKRPFQKGDHVLIKNPNIGQEDIGFIRDFAKNGYARVKTENQLITRSTENLRHIE